MADITTGEKPASQSRAKIIVEAQRLEESTLHSLKGHHEACSGWSRRHLYLGLPIVIISAIVGAAAFSQAAKTEPWIGVVAGLFSIAIAVLSGISTFLNPNEKQSAHLIAAHAFDKLNNDTRIFWSIEAWQEESEEVITSQLRELVERKNELNSKSPQIPKWAYKRAKKGIDEGQADFKVDKPAEPNQLPASSPEQAPVRRLNLAKRFPRKPD
ncbi:SLATT domain-containing protein [Tardiphaga sp. 813_E8_N1_3]|uniref:SLATT domain-containing protein n=1 Tax=Tardiphaga sp. 813_E8_N1_3 TaxID=3240760 RepID=UPI003F2322CB